MARSKRCTKCKTVKSIEHFGRLSSASDKRQSWCKLCKYKQNREYRRSLRTDEDLRNSTKIVPIGEENWSAKLTESDVRLIRQLEPPKYYEAAEDVAAKFEVSKWTILSIWRGRIWTHI